MGMNFLDAVKSALTAGIAIAVVVVSFFVVTTVSYLLGMLIAKSLGVI